MTDYTLDDAMAAHNNLVAQFNSLVSQLQPTLNKRLSKPTTPTAMKMLTMDASGAVATGDIPSAGAPATVTVSAGGDINAACQSAGVGAVIELSAGTYPITSAIAPLRLQTIRGPREAIIYGGVTVTGWTASGSNWVATISSLPASGNGNSGAQCELTTVGTNCSLPEQAWMNGTHLQRVFATPVASGQVYFDYTAKTITVGDDPTSATVEASITEYAIQSGASDVTLQGFSVDCFANPAQMGAVVPTGTSASDPDTGSRWLIKGLKTSRCHGSGIKLAWSHNSVVDHCVCQNNGQLGISVYMSQNYVVSNNTCTGNNTDGFYTHDWEAGGIKITNGSSGRCFGNLCVKNEGVGIWYDGYDGGWLDGNDVYNNTCVNNASCGIRYEIAPPGKIHDNFVANNGFRISRPTDISPWATGGINVNTSMDVQIYNNTSVGNRHACTFQYRTRSDAPTTLGKYLVWGNKFDMSHSASCYVGAVADSTTLATTYKANVTWGHNDYVLAGGAVTTAQFYESGIGSGGTHTPTDWFTNVGIDVYGKLTAPTVLQGPVTTTDIKTSNLKTASLTSGWQVLHWSTGSTLTPTTMPEWVSTADDREFVVPTGYGGTYTVTASITGATGSLTLRVMDSSYNTLSSSDASSGTSGSWTGVSLADGDYIQFEVGEGTGITAATVEFNKTG